MASARLVLVQTSGSEFRGHALAIVHESNRTNKRLALSASCLGGRSSATAIIA
jgi:hypothetical protein